MSKHTINTQIKQLYIYNESLDEEIIKEKQPTIYEQVVEQYGNWEKALESNGINRKKIKERQRFMLYALMKHRYIQYGPEALRPMNIDEETKEKIVESYKTLKALKETIISWSKQKVLYELRIHLLGGLSLETIEKDVPLLYERLLQYYEDMNEVITVYNQNFGSPTILYSRKKKVEEETKPMQEEQPVNMLDELAVSMVRLNYINRPEDLLSLQEAQKATKEEITQFVSQMAGLSALSGERLTLEMVYDKNPVMYFAIKMNYGDIKGAIEALMAQSVVG